jgi:UDP-N-acetylglucosamine 1-carboxyvinyltransferase
MTVIRNAAKEPEIVDLQGFLKSRGQGPGAGTDDIRIEGVTPKGPSTGTWSTA